MNAAFIGKVAVAVVGTAVTAIAATEGYKLVREAMARRRLERAAKAAKDALSDYENCSPEQLDAACNELFDATFQYAKRWVA